MALPLFDVGFTGTQEGMTGAQKEMFAKFARMLIGIDRNLLHEGDCVGADAQANEMWRAAGGLIHSHPPVLDRQRAFSVHHYSSEPAEYLTRNKSIVDSAQMMIATPSSNFEQLRSGTWATIRYARKKTKTLIIIFPDGHFTVE